jgi:apolipoprotein N-acyltransferase
MRLRWMGPLTALGIGATAWFAGKLIADATHASAMPFSVMLVQPHLTGEKEVPWRPWIELDRLTQASLDQEGPVDLIVWPESCLSISSPDDPTGQPGDGTHNFKDGLTVADFSETLLPRYRTNCLVGVALWRRAIEPRYGLQVPVARRYNCGCLVQASGAASCYEKQVLVPFREGVPAWLEEAPWIRSHFLPFFQLKGELTASRRFRLLAFRDQHNKERKIAVSICYEAFLFWLPQYQDPGDVEAIVHLVYDGVCHNHREVIQRQILACRYRAIETRTWNLVCYTWTGTAIIDPAGRIVAQIPSEPAVLRSDFIDRSVICRSIQSEGKTPFRDFAFRDGEGRHENLGSRVDGGVK